MTNPWIAAFGALFVWWFATGAILWAVKRTEHSGQFRRLTVMGLPLLGGGLVGVAVTTGAQPSMVWLAFLSALAVWGWIELAFLCGIITGPNGAPYDGRGNEWARFKAGWWAVAWHELALTAALAAVWWMTRGAVNDTAFWTFFVLYAARISAKLNLFYGAVYINTDFLPRPLGHLKSHFRQGPVSWLFPVSILTLSLASFCWLERLVVTGEVKFALLSALTILALLEHWLMVLPLPDDKLWRWAMPRRPDTPKILESETSR